MGASARPFLPTSHPSTNLPESFTISEGLEYRWVSVKHLGYVMYHLLYVSPVTTN